MCIFNWWEHVYVSPFPLHLWMMVVVRLAIHLPLLMHKKYFDLQLFTPKDFSSAQFAELELHLDTYIDDVREDVDSKPKIT